MTLRDRIVKGTGFLVLRNGLGLAVTIPGILIVTRLIGPGAYGQFAAALTVYNYLFNIAHLGIAVYLVRREGDLPAEEVDQAFSILLVSGFGFAFLAWLSTPLLAQVVTVQGFDTILRAFLFVMPLQVLYFVPLSLMERSLSYSTIARIELAGTVLNYGLAVALAAVGVKAWAPAIGWLANQVLVTLVVWRWVGRFPRLRFDRVLSRKILRYGISYSATVWLWQLRDLVNPIVVGRVLGAEGVGVVALAARIVEALAFVRNAVWRASLAGLPKLRDNMTALARAIRDGMVLQVLGGGVILVGGVMATELLLPPLFGNRWEATLIVLPFVALGALSVAAFTLPNSALLVVEKMKEVIAFQLAQIVLFGLTAALAVPRFGLLGYGMAEVAAIPSYLILLFFMRREIGVSARPLAALAYGSMAIALFANRIHPAVVAVVLLPFLLRRTRAMIADVVVPMFAPRRTGEERAAGNGDGV